MDKTGTRALQKSVAELASAKEETRGRIASTLRQAEVALWMLRLKQCDQARWRTW